MELTEEYDELLATLENLNPAEWLNIPKPVTHFLDHIKQLAVVQSKLIVQTNLNISKLSESVGHKFMNLKKKVTLVEDIENMIDKQCKELLEDLTIKNVLQTNRIEQKLITMSTDFDRKIKDEGKNAYSKVQILDGYCKSRMALINESVEKMKILLKEEVEQNIVPKTVDSMLRQVTTKLDK